MLHHLFGGQFLRLKFLLQRVQQVVEVTFHEGRPVTIQLPSSVELEVIETEPGFRGNTVNSVHKSCKLSTGLEVKVPMHINKGDVIRVNTETGEFLDRVNR